MNSVMERLAVTALELNAGVGSRLRIAQECVTPDCQPSITVALSEDF
jgi:hypothetical protein